MAYEVRPAKRSNTKPLFGIYGESGNGKTHTALLLARGIAGPTGRIIGIDTENERMEVFADIVPGGYDVIPLHTYSPNAYVEAITAAEKHKPDVLVIDSASHGWDGIGGVLDMAAEIEERTGKAGLHCWNKPKAQHKKFVQKIIGSSIPCIIVCMRAKHKSRQVGSGKGASIVKDEFSTPIQDEAFIFELLVHIEMLPGAKIRVSKSGHPDLRACLPADNTTPITVEHGEAVATWCAGGEHTRTPAIVVEARKHASKGAVAFRDWWNLPTSKEQWSILRPYISDFQRMAEQADEVERRKNAKFDDPFASGEAASKSPEDRVAEYEAAAASAPDHAAVDTLIRESADWTFNLPDELLARIEAANGAARGRLNQKGDA